MRYFLMFTQSEGLCGALFVPLYICPGSILSLVQILFSFVVIIIIIMIKLIIIHYHTQKQRKIKFEPRIKLNHNISTKRTCFSGFGALEQMCYGDLLGRALKQVPNVML